MMKTNTAMEEYQYKQLVNIEKACQTKTNSNLFACFYKGHHFTADEGHER